MDNRWSMPRRTCVLLVLFMCSCGRERAAFRRAAALHGGHIAAISAYAPLLSRPAGDDPQAPAEAGWRYAAQAARMEITLHASASYDLFGPPPRPPKNPTERIGAAFLDLRRACVLRGDEARLKGQAQQLADACRAAIERVNRALAGEDSLAQRAGLPAGTIPQIAPQSASAEALRASAALLRQAAPSAAEVARRALWQAADADVPALKRACEQSVRTAAVSGAAREIFNQCVVVKMAEEQLESVAKEPPGPSLCATMKLQAAAPGTPLAVADRLRQASSRCPPEHEGR